MCLAEGASLFLNPPDESHDVFRNTNYAAVLKDWHRETRFRELRYRKIYCKYLGRQYPPPPAGPAMGFPSGKKESW